jgi:hypothetical protein
LVRNGVPHRWIDLDHDPLADLIDEGSVEGQRLPLVLFPSARHLGPPPHRRQVAVNQFRIYPSRS